MTDPMRKQPVQEFFRIWTFISCFSFAPVLLFSFRSLWASLLCLALPALWSAVAARQFRWPGDRWVHVLLALTFWVVVSGLWSPSGRAMEDSLTMVLLVGFSALLLQTRIFQTWMLVMGILLSLVLVTIDIGTGNAIRQWVPPDQPPGKDAVATARGLGLTLIMLPPALLYMHRSGPGGGRWRGVVLLAGFASSLSGIIAYGLTLISALLASVLAALRAPLALRAILSAGAAALAMPFALVALLPPVAQLLVLGPLPDSMLHRLIIWRSVLDLWMEGRWLTGAGARAAHTLTDRLGDITLESGVDLPLVSAHPHNVPIQVLYEFGLIGYALAVAVCGLGARLLTETVWRRDMAAAIAALLAGLIVLISIEMDLWHLYFWCAVVISVLTLRAVAQDKPR